MAGGALAILRDRATLLGLVTVAGLAALQMPTPVHGDQALEIVYGRSLLDGKGMYGDAGLWDIRPPGVYLLHEVAAWLPGDDLLGARFLEALWLLATAVVACALVGTRLVSAAARFALPVLVVVHLAFAKPEFLGQPESFLGLPLLVACWGGLRGSRGGFARLFACGVALAVVVLLKHPFAAVPIAAWLVASRASGERVSSMLRRLLPAAAAALLALIIAAMWIYLTGDLADAAWSLLLFGPTTGGLDGRPIIRLFYMLQAAGALLGPALVLGTGYVLAQRRSLDTVDRSLATWALVGGALLLPQHWWPYHPIVLEVPVGILGTRAIDALAEHSRRRIAALAFVLVLPTAFATSTVADLAGEGFGLSAQNREALALADRPAVAQARAWVDTLEPSDGAFYFGDPIGQMLAHRPYAAGIHGWSPEWFDKGMWHRLTSQIQTSRPERIAMDEFSRDYADLRGEEFLALLAEGWCEAGGIDDVTWYVRRDLGEC